MPSLLQQQLQQISNTWGTVNKRQRGRPSLLYTAQEAADVDLQTLFELAEEGLEQLCTADDRFVSFRSTLFSQAGSEINRDGQTKAANEVLDANVEAYLQLLSDRFLTAPAFQTLEYLVRIYRVNEFNVDALIACGLPYHATNHFVRLVQILHLDQSLWRFLSPMQKSGAAMPRTVLVQRCSNDQAVLQAICESAKAASTSKTSNSSMQSFYAVVVCELLTGMQPVKEDTVRLLLPYLVAGLGGKGSADYHAATLMIVTLLASKTTLSEGLLTGLLQEMVRHVGVLQAGQVVMALCHIAVVQPQVTEISKKLVKRILKIPDLLPHLERLSNKGMALGPLLAWLLPHLGAGILDKKSWMECAIQMAKRLPLGMHAQLLASTVLHNLPKLSEAQRQSMTPLIRALDAHFPQEMDAAVNQLLQQGQGSDKAAAQQVFGLVQAALAGSAHAPLADAHSTLALAVDAPSAEMRVLALKELDAAHQNGDKQEASHFMQSVLLRRLADDEPTVLDAVLSLPSLLQMPTRVLYDALAGIMQKFRASCAEGTSSSERKAWRSVAQKVLHMLDASFLAKQPSLWQPIMLQLLDKSMIIGHNRQLALTAASALKQHAAKLLSGLSTLSVLDQDATEGIVRVGSPDSVDEIAPGTPNRPHKSSKEADLAFNNALIASLAKQLAQADSNEATSQAKQLILAAEGFPYARHTLLLALVQACHISKAPAVPAEALLTVVRAMWTDLQASESATGAALLPVVDEGGQMLAGHLKALNKKAAKAHAALLQTALLVALQKMPAAHLQSLSGDMAAAPIAASVLQLSPQSLFQQHCQALLEKVESPAALLAALAGAPTGTAAPAVPMAIQEHALQLLPEHLSSAAVGAADLNTLLPQLLTAAANPNKQLRQLAVSCLASATSTGQTAKLVEHVAITAACLEAFVTGLLQHEAQVVDDEQGLVQVVKQLLSPGTASDRLDRLSTEDSAAVSQYLLNVLPRLHTSTCTSAAMVVLYCTSSSQPSQRLQSAVSLLQHLPLGLAPSHGHAHTHGDTAPASSVTAGEVQLVCNLLQLFTAEAFGELLAHKPRTKAAKAAAPVILDSAEQLVLLTRFGADRLQDSLAAGIRQAAFGQLSPDVYACLPVQQQMKAFLALMNGSSRDSTEAVRHEARAALNSLPITAASLAPLLADFDGIEVGLAATPAASVKTRKRAKSSAAAFEAVEQLDILQLAGESTGVALCISVLELLQWKEDVQDEAQLLEPLSQVLSQLLDSTAQSAPAARSEPAVDDMDRSDEDEDAESLDTESADETQKSSNYSYAMGLALQAIHNIASRGPGDTVKALDTGLILQCADGASDSAVRNAALALVAVLAGKQPDNTLKHVLEVISVVGSSASQQQDSHSHQVAAATLAALVPAWLQAGKPLPDLTAAVVVPLPHMQPYRRLPLLSALLAAVPQDAARPVLLLQLLQQGLQAAPQQKPAAMVQGSTLAQNVEDQAWPVDLANAICQQGPMLLRVQALTALLQQALKAGQDQAAQALPALAVTLAATQVQESAVGVSAARSSTEVQAAYAALLEQSVEYLQLLGSKPASSKQERKAHKTAEDAAYQLLDSLAKVMEGSAYIGALLKLVQHPSEAVVRRALRLISNSVAKASQTDAAQAQPGTAEKPSSSTAEAAVQLCRLAPVLLQTEATDAQLGPATRQAALLALSQVGQHVGQTNPQAVMAILPSIVAAAKDVHRSVRSSALAAAAACLVALGSAVLPLLPTLVPAILAAAQTAVHGLPEKEEQAFQEQEESSEAAGLEAASALAAVGALVDGLKAFLSPYLAALLQLLFSPQLLACKQAGCSDAAGNIRIQLAAAIPPRLLLAPLFGYLDSAIQEGEAAAMSLLAMVQRTVEQMDASTAAQHAEACYSFLLQALDTRQRRPAQLSSVEGVEKSSVAVLLGLTMKLSEAKFKPLFLRLLDWASSAPAAEPDVKPLGRQIALFSAVLGLSDRLRSVFVPYFRYLLDPIAAHLGGTSSDAADGPRKKRKKRSSAVAVMGDTSSDPAVVEDTWRLRLKVVQALHGCFQNDTVSFLDEARFHRLLPLLVQQLSMQLPPDVATALQAQQETPASAAAQRADAADGLGSSDAYGDAVVAALVQMAVIAHDDALWKALNHQVLMVTRSPAVEERMRALAAVSGLVTRMREDYLLLLPEALPFLAELLEDPEHEIVSLTQQLIKKLEELSGESLEQYLTV